MRKGRPRCAISREDRTSIRSTVPLSPLPLTFSTRVNISPTVSLQNGFAHTLPPRASWYFGSPGCDCLSIPRPDTSCNIPSVTETVARTSLVVDRAGCVTLPRRWDNDWIPGGTQKRPVVVSNAPESLLSRAAVPALGRCFSCSALCSLCSRRPLERDSCAVLTVLLLLGTTTTG